MSFISLSNTFFGSIKSPRISFRKRNSPFQFSVFDSWMYRFIKLGLVAVLLLWMPLRLRRIFENCFLWLFWSVIAKAKMLSRCGWVELSWILIRIWLLCVSSYVRIARFSRQPACSGVCPSAPFCYYLFIYKHWPAVLKFPAFLFNLYLYMQAERRPANQRLDRLAWQGHMPQPVRWLLLLPLCGARTFDACAARLIHLSKRIIVQIWWETLGGHP